MDSNSCSATTNSTESEASHLFLSLLLDFVHLERGVVIVPTGSRPWLCGLWSLPTLVSCCLLLQRHLLFQPPL